MEQLDDSGPQEAAAKGVRQEAALVPRLPTHLLGNRTHGPRPPKKKQEGSLAPAPDSGQIAQTLSLILRVSPVNQGESDVL